MIEILKWPDKRMTDLVVERVTKFDDDLKMLCDHMAEAMIAHNGAGLAATQVGDPRAVFILNSNLIDGLEELDYVAFVNPELLELSEEKEKGMEGCLSFPREKAVIDRHTSLLLKANTITGDSLELKCEGFVARAVQHENDHLLHIYISDRVGTTKKTLMTKRVARLAKQSK
jgi:peptide deformylase